MKLTFELNLRPLAHQSFKIGRNGIKYKPKKVTDYQITEIRPKVKNRTLEQNEIRTWVETRLKILFSA